MIVIANIILLIGSLIMVYSGTLKKKKLILLVQTSHILLFIIGNLLLGGITGAISNALGAFRNILCYFEKLNIWWMSIIAMTAVILGISFNDLGVIGLLPIISVVVFTYGMNTKNIFYFKGLIIFSMSMWLIYDIYIKGYSAAIFDFLTIITNTISIMTIKKKKRA